MTDDMWLAASCSWHTSSLTVDNFFFSYWFYFYLFIFAVMKRHDRGFRGFMDGRHGSEYSSRQAGRLGSGVVAEKLHLSHKLGTWRKRLDGIGFLKPQGHSQ